jgi:hypothetical protein
MSKRWKASHLIGRELGKKPRDWYQPYQVTNKKVTAARTMYHEQRLIYPAYETMSFFYIVQFTNYGIGSHWSE